MAKVLSIVLVFASVAAVGMMLASAADSQISKRHAQIEQQMNKIEG